MDERIKRNYKHITNRNDDILSDLGGNRRLKQLHNETKEITMNRFDYVKYDHDAQRDQAEFKEAFIDLERDIETIIKSPRAKALALTKLEECYMWVGKGIRDDQIERTGKIELEEDRSDS
jgi:hypothetical protein